MLSEMNGTNVDPTENFYKDVCKFIQKFQKQKNDKHKLLMLIGDWNKQCVETSNLKELYDEFDLVNIFYKKFANHEKIQDI